MTSQEIFKMVNPQAMFQQEQAAKLQEAQTGISKQNVVTQAILSRMPMQQGTAPQQPMPQQPNGWGRTA